MIACGHAATDNRILHVAEVFPAGRIRGLGKRVIACLDVRSNDQGDLVVTKGDQYDVRERDGAKDVRNLGLPVALADRYFTEGADEVAFLNITGFRDSPLGDMPMLQARACSPVQHVHPHLKRVCRHENNAVQSATCSCESFSARSRCCRSCGMRLRRCLCRSQSAVASGHSQMPTASTAVPSMSQQSTLDQALTRCQSGAMRCMRLRNICALAKRADRAALSRFPG